MSLMCLHPGLVDQGGLRSPLAPQGLPASQSLAETLWNELPLMLDKWNLVLAFPHCCLFSDASLLPPT